jgi:hypothetical protein
MKIRNGLIWSTFLLLLVISLVAPSTKSYGQLIAQESLLSKRNSKLFYYNIDNKSASSGIEHWMIVPWENSYFEEELRMESWMIAPFRSMIIDEDLTVESWMSVPFGTDQDTEVEDWMASVWF